VSEKKNRNFSGFEFPTKPPFRTLVNKTSTTSTDKGKLIDILIRVSEKLSASFYRGYAIQKRVEVPQKMGTLCRWVQLFVEMGNVTRKLRLKINQEKTKCMIVERKNTFTKDI
jgi:hypothetical protein